MTNSKEPMIIEIFEETQTIFISSRHLGNQELCDGMMSIGGVTSVVCENYRLIVMYGEAFIVEEIAPRVLAMLCTAIGTTVDAVEVRPGFSIKPVTPDELDWLVASAAHIQTQMTTASLRTIIAICDEELAAHTAAIKQLRQTKNRAKRRLAKHS